LINTLATIFVFSKTFKEATKNAKIEI